MGKGGSKTKKRENKRAAAAAKVAPLHGGVAKQPMSKEERQNGEALTAAFKGGKWEDALVALSAIRAAGQSVTPVLCNKARQTSF